MCSQFAILVGGGLELCQRIIWCDWSVGLHDFEGVCHSSHLQDIIPAGLEEEGVGVDVEGGGVGMSTLALDSVMGYGGEEEEEEEGEVGSEKSSEDTARKE